MLLVAYVILFCLYACLALLYVLAPPTPPTPIPPWPLLPIVPEAAEKPTAVPCQADADCEPNHVCLGTVCVRKLLRGGQCHPDRGQWISHRIEHATFAVCTCLDPHLYAQKFFGGDCSVDVACGVHGTYNPATRACDCEPGYKPVAAPLTCQKLTALEYQNVLAAAAAADPCGPDEFPVAQTDLAHEGFHAHYIARLQASQAPCVKRPCTFDALTGRPLKRSRYVKNWGCVCDPRYGLFGVQLEGHDKAYLASPGFDACASIYVEEPDHPRPIQHITYFYLKNREPVSILLFHDVKRTYLTPLFKGKRDPFMISQSLWRYDFAQAFFRQNATFRARTRKVDGMSLFQTIVRINEHLYVPYAPPSCDAVARFKANLTTVNSPMAYKLLHGFPVCKVLINDPYAPALFWNKVVVNPMHLTLEGHDSVPHYNAFALKYEGAWNDRWTLELDYEYDIDRFRAFTTNAPDYSKRLAALP